MSFHDALPLVLDWIHSYAERCPLHCIDKLSQCILAQHLGPTIKAGRLVRYYGSEGVRRKLLYNVSVGLVAGMPDGPLVAVAHKGSVRVLFDCGCAKEICVQLPGVHWHLQKCYRPYSVRIVEIIYNGQMFEDPKHPKHVLPRWVTVVLANALGFLSSKTSPRCTYASRTSTGNTMVTIVQLVKI